MLLLLSQRVVQPFLSTLTCSSSSASTAHAALISSATTSSGSRAGDAGASTGAGGASTGGGPGPARVGAAAAADGGAEAAAAGAPAPSGGGCEEGGLDGGPPPPPLSSPHLRQERGRGSAVPRHATTATTTRAAVGVHARCPPAGKRGAPEDHQRCLLGLFSVAAWLVHATPPRRGGPLGLLARAPSTGVRCGLTCTWAGRAGWPPRAAAGRCAARAAACARPP